MANAARLLARLCCAGCRNDSRFCCALCCDHCRISLTLCDLASLLRFLPFGLNYELSLLGLLFSDLFLLHCNGIFFAKVDIAQDEINHPQIILCQTFGHNG